MVKKRLLDLRDEAYASFQARLLPTVDPGRIIGVRTPALRALARELDGTDEAAQEFADVHLKVELGEEGLSRYGKKKTVSVFSNVDFLLGRNRQDKQESDDKSAAGGSRTRASDDDDEASRQEKREPVSMAAIMQLLNAYDIDMEADEGEPGGNPTTAAPEDAQDAL